MGGLIARLRETYRPDDTGTFKSTQINDLIKAVEKLLATHLRHSNVHLKYDLQPNLPDVSIIQD